MNPPAEVADLYDQPTWEMLLAIVARRHAMRVMRERHERAAESQDHTTDEDWAA